SREARLETRPNARHCGMTVRFLWRAASRGRGELNPSLDIAEGASRWLPDRFERDGVRAGTVRTARLMLSLRNENGGILVVDCATELETESRLERRRWCTGPA